MAVERDQEIIKAYYVHSKKGYDLILWGSQHFGYHPNGKKISEKKAQLLMQDKIAEKLSLKSTDYVLDCGCGQGVVSTYLAAKYGCRTEGVTIVPHEINSAKQRAQKMGLEKQCQFHVADYNDNKFPDETFDCVFFIETLSHSLSLPDTLKEVFRVMKKGAKVAFFEYSIQEDHLFKPKDLEIMNAIIDSSGMYSLRDLRHGVFTEMLKEAGFINITEEDATECMKPSLRRLRNIALIPFYILVKPFGRYRRHPNMTSAVEGYRMRKYPQPVLKYVIYQAEKP